MNVLHVDVVCRNGVGNGVVGEGLWIAAGQRSHLLGIELEGVVAELDGGDALEALAACWEVAVSLDPAIAVHVDSIGRPVLVLRRPAEANDISHRHSVRGGTCLDEGPVERISVVGDKDGWTDKEDVLEEAGQQGTLILGIVHGKVSGILGTGRVLKGLDVVTDNLPICDQMALHRQ